MDVEVGCFGRKHLVDSAKVRHQLRRQQTVSMQISQPELQVSIFLLQKTYQLLGMMMMSCLKQMHGRG